jgi:hypothetical protein
MADRERLLEILNVPIYPHEKVDPLEAVADYLLDNGVTFKPAIPGPSEADPNIMELCFRNGENHMRDKIRTNLLKLSTDMPCVTISQVIKILEDLQ